MARRWRFEAEPEQAIKPSATATLRPQGGLKVVVRAAG
jgi:hypothetical protein